MDLDLVGYLLGLLDPDEHRRTEVALRDDPAACRRLDRLRATFAPLESIRGDGPVPVGLAERTLAHVAAHTDGPPMPDRPTPARRVSAPDDRPVFQPSRWRRADALVTTAILVVISGLGVSGVARIHEKRDIILCQNNLRLYHQALAGYSLEHQGRFPQVQDQPPLNLAGAFVPVLRDAGQLPPGYTPDCPVVSVAAGLTPVGYAYTLGYRDAAGRLHGLRRDDDPAGTDTLPILADRPRPAGHGRGFNVLFIGGNVRFCTSPNVGVDGDDIFINQAAAVAAGLHRLDSVLGPSDTSP
jgi:prepilin-type processing-associated H-X9-DG protein